MASDNILGIDLGTTNSVIAILDGEQPRVIPSIEGSPRTPSVVSFLPGGEIVVGEVARRQAAVNPLSAITSVKRLMGRSPSDVVALGIAPTYQLASGPKGELLIQVGDQGFTPAQVSAFILARLKKSAEDYLGEEINKAIITVPAYFDDLQRQATREAGDMAGLEVLRLVNEPTAAAMAYGLGRGEAERVAVYDFGGGTFDLTVLDIASGTFEVLTSVGDTHLGGDDIDDLLVKSLLARFAAQHGKDIPEDPMLLRRLKEAAEKAKCELSIAKQALIHLPFLAQVDGTPLHLEETLTRKELEELAYPLVERTLTCCRDALEECELTPKDINRVILVGGSTRIPLVQDLVEDYFGIQPFKGINPDEIVALGAATQAGVLAGKLKEVLLLDVTPHSLGVEVTEGRTARIIEKNSTIPLKAARLFTTTEDGQEMVVVHVVQGEADRVSENRSLGKFTLSGLQPGKAGTARVQVAFQINADGMVEVSAEDLISHHQQSIALTVGGEQDSPLAGVRERASQIRRKRKSPGKSTSGEVLTGRNPTESQLRLRPVTVLQRPGASQPTPVEGGFQTPSAGVPSVAQEFLGASAVRSTESVENNDDFDMAATEGGAGVRSYPVTQTAEAEVQTEPFANDADTHLSEEAASALSYIKDHALSATAYDAYLKAYQELLRYAKAYPGDSAVAEGAVRILVTLGERDEAHKLLKLLSEGTGTDPLVLADLYELFLTKFPQDESAVAGQARTLANLGRLDEAIVALERVASEEKGTDQQVDSLIQLYRRRLTHTEDPATQLNLVRLLIRTGRVDEAINLLQRLVQNENYRLSALKILGLCFWQKGLHYLAWQKFQQLPASEEVKDILYRLSADMEDTDQLLNAKVVLQHLHDMDPSYKDVEQRLKRVEQLIRLEAGDRDSNLTPSIFLTLKDSRFVILEEINRGSMGIVYRARDKVLEEIVALKILNDYMTGDPTAVERFKREARAAKRLSHPNIVRIHDMFEYGNKKLLSMEYIEGVDVKKLLQDRGILPVWEIAGIVRSVCDALGYAHKLSIVHRDIKPANVMLTDNNQVKVTDFGIAKLLLAGKDATRSGSQIIGTPLYMSPEQIRGDAVDGRTDLYSLGATMYEMATGRPPFLDGNIEYHHLHTAPAPLPENVPENFAQIILKCLAKVPASRFQSTDELATALNALAGM
ncbi:MAG: Hsp70 family protein [Candidatus Sumerlaeaceae bacterium]